MKAWELLSDESNWTDQDLGSLDSDGKIVRPWSPDAVKWSAAGAIWKVIYDSEKEWKENLKAFQSAFIRVVDRPIGFIYVENEPGKVDIKSLIEGISKDEALRRTENGEFRFFGEQGLKGRERAIRVLKFLDI